MRKLLPPFVLLVAVPCLGQLEPADVGANRAAQSAADALKTFTGADAAFFAGALVRPANLDRNDLKSILEYPTESILIMSLTGAQIKAAFERSVSLYPQPSTSFLQISGFVVTFNKSAVAGQRIVSVMVGTAPLDPQHTYTVAMPASLGRGGLGYFKIWDKSNITKVLDKQVEDALAGQKYADTPLRWLPQ